MKPIDLGLGPKCVVKGTLFDTMDPVYLIDDLLEIDLPSGDTVSVEWDADSGPQGRFAIVVFRDYWENRRLTQVANTPQEVVDRLRLLAWSAAGQTSCSTVSDIQRKPLKDVGVTDWTPEGEWSRFEHVQAATHA